MFKVLEDHRQVNKGMIFGKRTVMGVPFQMRTWHPRSTAKGDRNTHCVVQCECGKAEVIAVATLTNTKPATSCMTCRKRKSRLTHGNSKKRLYVVWHGMKHRCHCPKSSAYATYGARGISVGDEWREDFEAFESWALANGYRRGLQIDDRQRRQLRTLELPLGVSRGECNEPPKQRVCGGVR